MRTPDGLPAEVPDLRIAHLSDIHLTAGGTRYNHTIDPFAALDRAAAVLARAVADGSGPEVIVVSGDLTDSGDPAAYRLLAATLNPLAPTVVYATGNHDVRTAFHAELLGISDPGPRLQVVRLPRLRILVLDSTVPGAGHGHLDAAHLADLAAELEHPHPGGSVVVLHHAPLPPPSPLLTYFALDRASRIALGRVLAGTDTRVVLAGHHHLAGSGTLAGIPVAVAGSTAIRTDPLARPGHERTTTSGSFNLIGLYPDGAVTVSVLPVDTASEVFDLDEAGCRAVIDASPIPENDPERSAQQ